jgi:hypothetical protein
LLGFLDGHGVLSKGIIGVPLSGERLKSQLMAALRRNGTLLEVRFCYSSLSVSQPVGLECAFISGAIKISLH